METSNPVLTHKAFEGAYVHQEPMTLQGTINKTAILLLCVTLTAAGTWHLFMQAPSIESIAPLFWVGTIGGLIFALLTIVKKNWSPVTAPIYALFEGVALGGISALFEVRFPGIAMQAVVLTFGTLLALLMAYRSGLVQATEKFKLGVVAATGGIALGYLITMILNFFNIAVLTVSGPVSIGISVFIVIIAALNLILDFAMIEEAIQIGAPKYMEWYGAFGLMVTLIWLYLEILKLLGKTRKRN